MISDNDSKNIKNGEATDLSLLLGCLSEIYAWEMENLSFMQTTTGRYLYHALAQQTLIERSGFEQPLKPLFLPPHFTERALRIRMQEMSAQGLIQTSRSDSDSRSKFIAPTEKLLELALQHAEISQGLLRRKFLMIPK